MQIIEITRTLTVIYFASSLCRHYNETGGFYAATLNQASSSVINQQREMLSPKCHFCFVLTLSSCLFAFHLYYFIILVFILDLD